MRMPALLALAAAVAAIASLAQQGPVPGDEKITLALQALFGGAPVWAGWLTNTAKAPFLWGTVALGALLAWRVAGLRGAVSVPLAYAFAFAADKGLRAVLFVPRPDQRLVAVAEPAATSGLPSTFGIVYGAIFGAALLASGPVRRARPARIAAGVLLIAGASARIVLGGHWSSQMIASAAFGLLLALGALAVTDHLPLRKRR